MTTRIQLQKLMKVRSEGWSVKLPLEEVYGGDILIQRGSSLAYVKPDGTVVEHNMKRKF